LIASTTAINCLERLVSETTYYVSSETLNPCLSIYLSISASILTNLATAGASDSACTLTLRALQIYVLLLSILLFNNNNIDNNNI